MWVAVGIFLLWALVDYPGQLHFGRLHGSVAATMLCLIAAWVAVLVRPKMPPVSRAGGLLLAGLLVVSAVTTAAVAPTSEMRQNVAVYVAMFGLATLGSYFDDGDVFRRTVAFALASSTLAAAAYLVSVARAGPGATELFGPRPFALYCLVFAAVALAMRRVWPAPCYLALGILAAAIALSQSRTATVAVVGLTVVAVLRDALARSAHRVAWVVALAAVSATAVIAVWNLVPAVRARFQERGDSAIHVGSYSISTSGRSHLWRVAWDYFQSSPVVGHGLGSSEHHIMAIVAGTAHPHNDYLKILDDIGVLGAVVLLVGLVLLLRPLARMHAVHDVTSSQRAAVARWSLIALGICMITDNPLSYMFVAGPVALFVGLGLGGQARRASDSDYPATVSARPAALPSSS
jgi:O-antigen ligase